VQAPVKLEQEGVQLSLLWCVCLDHAAGAACRELRVIFHLLQVVEDVDVGYRIPWPLQGRWNNHLKQWWLSEKETDAAVTAIKRAAADVARALAGKALKEILER